MENDVSGTTGKWTPSELSEKYPFTVFYQGRYEKIPSYGIIDMVKKNLDLIQEMRTVKPMLYLLIETLQNIERYSTHKVSSEDCSLIYMDDHNFYVYTQNLVDNSKVARLKERLESLEGKTKEQLDNEFKTTLAAGEKTEKGAGLGLIDLARKTNNRLFYELTEFNSESSAYAVCFAMPIDRKNAEHLPNFDETRELVARMKNRFGMNDSTLLYTGDFSNKFVHALLNFLKNSKDASEGSNDSKLHYILIELTQNVRRYASKIKGVSQGQLIIEWNGKDITIATVNAAEPPHGSQLQEKIKKMNACTPAELKQYHDAILTDFTTDSGVGLIDVATLIKGNKMRCDIAKKSIFADEVTIKLNFNNE
jgi:hypothetical protein